MRRTTRRTKPKQNTVLPDIPEAHVHEALEDFATRSMRDYGTEVVEQRAIPDFRDGLKPVHRATLWAMYKLGLHNNSQFKKSARTVGEVIAKYHPHGDKSVYDAMVGVAGVKNDAGVWSSRNSPVPLVEGYGNWGSNIENAAAYRYTESRLSKFADTVMLDPDYVAVMDMVPNFDESEVQPLILPAKLPIALINGSRSIAVGVSAACPSFTYQSVTKLVLQLLAGTPLDLKTVVNTLEFKFAYGGNCVSPKKEIAMVVKTGKGSLKFVPDYDIDELKRVIHVRSACPGMTSQGTIQSTLNKIAALKGVASVEDESGKHKVLYTVKIQRNVVGAAFEALANKVVDNLTKPSSYEIGMTIRTLEGTKFRRTNIIEMLEWWVKWRLELEVKMLKRLISIATEKKVRQELYLKAVLNLAIILASLKVDDSVKYLMTKMKITEEEANIILDMKVRSLKSLESAKIKKTIESLDSDIAQNKAHLKAPSKRVITDLNALLKGLDV